MKTTNRIGLVGLLMVAMAGSAWGTDYPTTVTDDGYFKLVLTSPNVAVFTLRNWDGVYNGICSGAEGHSCRLEIYKQGGLVQSTNVFRSAENNEIVTATLEYDTSYESHLFYTVVGGGDRRLSWSLTVFRTHASPTDPDPEPPAPQPETPEPGTPEPGTPEPETPEPETPEPDACPVEPRCDHIAIVPSMPRAMSGNEDTPDHWLRITNPYGEGITFAVTGRDESGTKFGTYRRELPAWRSVKVLMRDIEAAFDDPKPEGWWTLTVTGSGTVHVVPMMRHGEARIVLPVVQPESCESR